MSAPAAPVRILVVNGSLREASYNGRLARLAASLTAEAGAEAVLLEGLHAVEPFDEDTEPSGTPPGAAAFKEAVDEADAVFVVTPEYNGSVPGQLKNAFDWASRSDVEPFRSLPDSPMFGVPFAVASVSTGQFGGVWARDELVKVLRTQGGRAVVEPAVAVPNADTAWDTDGVLTNTGVNERLVELLGNLVDQATLVRAAKERTAATAS